MHQALALTKAVEVGGDDRNLRDETKSLAPLRVLRIIIARRVETAEGADAGADGVHGRRVFRELAQDVHHAFGQLAEFGEDLLELGEFFRVRQMVVVEEVGDLFVSGATSQFVDVVAAVNQLADVAAHIAETSVGGDDAFQTFCGSCRSAHAKNRRRNLGSRQVMVNGFPGRIGTERVDDAFVGAHAATSP